MGAEVVGESVDLLVGEFVGDCVGDCVGNFVTNGDSDGDCVGNSVGIVADGVGKYVGDSFVGGFVLQSYRWGEHILGGTHHRLKCTHL